MRDPGLAMLSERLCPWLRAPLQTLESALAKARLGHAWLIVGPPGLGKLNLALALAERLLRGTTGGPLPPDLDPTAAAAAMRTRHSPGDHHPDLHWLYPEEDKRTISVEQVRATTESLALKGFKGGAKVVVIEPAEAMTAAAANALLKSLEEPSPGTYMLLISHQPGRLPSTIRSRCQTLVVRGPRPAADTARAPDGGRQGLGSATGSESAPLLLAQRAESNYDLFIKDLYDNINLIYQNKRDPQAVADAWRKDDIAGILDGLIGALQKAIRARIVARASNRITEPRADVLHNCWDALSISALFDQLAAAERLRDQIGGGVNVDLALSVLLMGFEPERGET